MGTRADFYVQNPVDLEWLGSIAWDGYPSGIDEPVIRAESVAGFREAVSGFLGGRTDATFPERGWPWPWNDSGTTDYGYVFVPETGVVHQHFAGGWGL